MGRVEKYLDYFYNLLSLTLPALSILCSYLDGDLSCSKTN